MNSKLNVIALICAIAMMVSCFLPWEEASSSVSVMGYSSSYYASANGIDSGIGYMFLSIAVACVVMIFMKNKFMIIPGALNLLLSILQSSGMIRNTVSVNTGFGHGHAGAGIGIYILIGSCIIYVISTIKNLSPSGVSQVANPVTTENAPLENQKAESTIFNDKPKLSPLQEKLNTEVNVQEYLNRKPIKINYKLIILIVVLFSGWQLFDRWKTKKDAQQYSISNERTRLNNIISNINDAIKKRDYDMAIVLANQIDWQIEPSENSEYVTQYNKQKDDFLKTITQLKHDYEVMYEKMQKDADLQDVYAAIDILPELRESDQMFQGTRSFCDTEGSWILKVTAQNDTITILSFPGPKNTYYANKNQATSREQGIIVRKNIIATKNDHGQWRQIYRYVNNTFYQADAEGTENVYPSCTN